MDGCVRDDMRRSGAARGGEEHGIEKIGETLWRMLNGL